MAARVEESLSLTEILGPGGRKMGVILLLAPVLIVTWKYYGTPSFYLGHLSNRFVLFGSPLKTAEWYTYLSAFTLFGVLPVAVFRLLFREPLPAYGLGLGEWRFWMPAALALGPVLIFLSYLASSNPQFMAEYPLCKSVGESAAAFALHAVGYLLFYIGWETLFRGIVQSGLSERFGVWGAVLVQTALSCLAHIGKPDGEIFGSLAGGVVWGVLVFRSRSILPAVITHWLLGVSLDFFICFG